MITLLMNLEIYWSNLFIYLFWISYVILCYFLYRYSDKMYFWLYEKTLDQTEEMEK